MHENAARPATLLRGTLVALLVTLGLLAAGPALAAPGDEAVWGVMTASTDQGEGRENYSYSVDAGSSLDDAVVIANHGTKAIDLDIYGADAFTTQSGQLDLLKRDEEQTGIGVWVTPETDHVTIKPGESTQVGFSLSVPDNATPGDYAGGIVTSMKLPDQQQGINVDRRLGIRIHLRVNGELAPSVSVENLHVDYSGTINPFAAGTATVTYTVHNTGNTRINGGQDVSVAAPFGLLRSGADDLAAMPELLPGESWDVSAPVSAFPGFRLTAATILTPHYLDETGTDTTMDAVRATAGVWAVPWALLAVVVVVAGIVVLLVLRRRRRTSREDARVKEAVEQALREREAAAGPNPGPTPTSAAGAEASDTHGDGSTTSDADDAVRSRAPSSASSPVAADDAGR